VTFVVNLSAIRTPKAGPRYLATDRIGSAEGVYRVAQEIGGRRMEEELGLFKCDDDRPALKIFTQLQLRMVPQHGERARPDQPGALARRARADVEPSFSLISPARGLVAIGSSKSGDRHSPRAYLLSSDSISFVSVSAGMWILTLTSDS
jgi:hypothetical protein